jgi:hypothetical protein
MKQRCPCCGYYTLHKRADDEICQVCFWHDDGQDENEANEVRGGPNGTLSLTQARENFRKFRAIERRFVSKVREPRPAELHA